MHRIMYKFSSSFYSKSLKSLFLVILISLVSYLIYIDVYGVMKHSLIDRETIQKINNHQYYAKITTGSNNNLMRFFYESKPDNNDYPSQSNLAIMQNNELLQFPHTPHAQIASEGLGRFSHWGEGIYFSSLDNTSPLNNTYIYNVYEMYHLKPIFKIILITVNLIAIYLLISLNIENLEIFFFSIMHITTVVLYSLFILFLLFVIYALISGYALPASALFLNNSFVDLVYFEPYLPYLFLTLALILFMLDSLYSNSNSYTADSIEKSIFIFFKKFGFFSTLGVLLFALGCSQSGIFRHEDLNTSAIAGIIPFNDAAGYYSDSIQQAFLGHWSEVSDRRPIAASLRSFFYFLGNYDYNHTLLVQCIYLSLCLYFSTLILGYILGVWSMLIYFSLAIVQLRPYLATFLTEPIGMGLAMLSISSIASSFVIHNKRGLLSSIALHTISQFVRMGAMFTIPGLIFWSILLQKHSKKFMAIVAFFSAVIVAFLIGSSKLIIYLYGTGLNQIGGNYAALLYGISVGKYWDQIYKDYGQQLSLLKTEGAQNAFIYNKAITNIAESPTIFFSRLYEGLVLFCNKIFNVMIEGYRDIPVSPTIKYVFYIFFVFAFLRNIKSTPKYILSYFIIMFVCIVISAPLIIFDDGWRTISLSYFTIIFILCFFFKRRKYVFNDEVWLHFQGPNALKSRLIFSSWPLVMVLILIISLSGPYLSNLFFIKPSQEISKTIDKSNTDEVLIGKKLGWSTLSVYSDSQVLPYNTPAIHISELTKILISTGIESDYHSLLENRDVCRPPFIIMALYAFHGDFHVSFHGIISSNVFVSNPSEYYISKARWLDHAKNAKIWKEIYDTKPIN